VGVEPRPADYEMSGFLASLLFLVSIIRRDSPPFAGNATARSIESAGQLPTLPDIPGLGFAVSTRLPFSCYSSIDCAAASCLEGRHESKGVHELIPGAWTRS
jgi:hypothetical protein